LQKLPVSLCAFFVLAIVLLLSAPAKLSGGVEQTGRDVRVIPVSGEVDPGMAAFIKRALAGPDNTPDTLFVLEIDTFGGRVDSALQIVDGLLELPTGRTVAFVRNKAISAGALIALACNELVMAPHSTLGDVAPITYSSEGPKVMGEKFQSPLRAKFRALAKRNGYSPTLAEAMVTAEMEVHQVKADGIVSYLDSQEYAEFTRNRPAGTFAGKIVVPAGELLTMDNEEAQEFGFSRLTAASLPELLEQLHIESPRINRISSNWSENLGRLISSVAPILLMIGLAALYTELKAPGFGLPGIVGILCLGLVFFNQFLVGLADYTELILFCLGAVLLAFEFFVIPGFGITGLAGFFCIGAGLILSFQDFVIPDPAMPWQQEIFTRNIFMVLGAFVIAVMAALFFLRYVFPRLSRVVYGPYLSASLKDSRVDSPAFGEIKIGDAGVVKTLLRPAGKAEFNNMLYDVVSQGEFVETGARITVLEIKGNRIVVARETLA